MSDTFNCGHPRTPENTKMKGAGRRRKDGTLRKHAYCRRCYNAARMKAWHRNNPRKPKKPPIWEIDIRVRRSGKLVAHTKDRTYTVASVLRCGRTELEVLQRALDNQRPPLDSA
jgi:hypothetical protein